MQSESRIRSLLKAISWRLIASTATTIIPPNYNIVKDDFGNIIITKEE